MTFLRTRPARSAAITLALLIAGSALAALPTVASAGTPATVPVRVIGLSGNVLLNTSVTTNTTPVDKDGNPADTCTGTSALGALNDATQGNWVGAWDGSSLGYEVDGIEGLTFPSFSNSPDAYWAEWIGQQGTGTTPDQLVSGDGGCADELGPQPSGEAISVANEVLFFAQCDATGPDCPNGATSPDPLAFTAPSVAQVGTPIAVEVTKYDNANSFIDNPSPAASPASGATVSAGPVSAQTNAQGAATLTFSTTGTFTLQASGAGFVPAQTQTICVHNGNDGNCGTTAPPTVTTPTTNTATSTTTSTTSTAVAGVVGTSVKAGPAVAAYAASVLNSHVYATGKGPRTLAGHVTTTGTLKEVRLRLTRNDDGVCSYYDGTTERFHKSKCGVDHGVFFDVGASATFTYLLPSRLGPGRYVFDIEAVDAAGQVSALYHGTSRIVFYVKK